MNECFFSGAERTICLIGNFKNEKVCLKGQVKLPGSLPLKTLQTESSVCALGGALNMLQSTEITLLTKWLFECLF